jgi:hypothetical protein
MPFAVDVEAIANHWHPTFRAHWRNYSAKNAASGELKFIGVVAEDHCEHFAIRKIYQA